MAELIDKFVWTLTASTAATTSTGAWHDVKGHGNRHSFYMECGALTSGTIWIQTARSSASTAVTTLSTTAMSTLGVAGFFQATDGPLFAVRPVATDMSTGGTIIVEMVVN